jgi:hypothetical protein
VADGPIRNPEITSKRCGNQLKHFIPLETKWVENNLDQSFLGQITNVFNKKAAFVCVPSIVGDHRKQDLKTYSDLVATGLKVQYV